MEYLYQNFTDYLWSENRNNNNALVDNEINLTYAQLKNKIYSLASYLLEKGVKKGDKVLYSLAPGYEFIVFSMAVITVGAVCCGVPYGMPLIGIQKVYEDLNPKLFICNEELKNNYSGSFPNVVSFNDFSFAEYDEAVINENKEKVLLDDPAFILYTSGTVHAPKGAILTHKNIIAECEFASKHLFKSISLSSNDVFLHAFPVNHVSGCVECGLIPLYLGSCIVFMKKFHPQTFIENILKYNVSIVCGVPAMWSMIIDFMDAYNIKPFKVRGCLSGAAILKNKLKNRIIQLCDCFENPLGMTEASGFISYSNNCDNGSIGKMFDEIQYKIDLKDDGTGELLVKGDNIISGYYNHSMPVDRDGYYHTNDIVYEDENHYLYLCGRNDDMFTVGGYCVHPSEVEEVIMEYPGIKDVIVLPIPHQKMGNVCRCYIVARENIDLEKLQKFAEERLLSYKVPRNFVVLEKLPINGSGKVDKKLLKDNIKKEFGLD